MSKYIVLLKLQVKAAFGALPKIFAGTAAFSLLMGLIVLGGTYYSAHSGGQERMQVALVLPSPESEESRYLRMAFEFLSEIDTVKSVCEFIPAENEQTALTQLKNGSLTAVVVIPEHFISSIMNGENIPASVIFAKSGVHTSSALFQEMLRSGASDLGTAQAGIYAVDDVCRFLSGQPDAVLQAEEYLNDAYFSYALDRNIYFETVPVSEAHGLSAIQFYTAAGLVLLLLLGGITCVELLRPVSGALAFALKRRGIVSGVCHAFQVFGVSAVYFVLFGSVYLLTALSTLRYPAMGNVLGFSGGLFSVLSGLAGLFVLLFCIYAFVGLIYQLSGRSVSGALILFLLSVAMLFASGMFIPSSMLPPLVKDIGAVLPSAGYFKLCGQILTGDVQWQTLVWNLIYAAGFLFISAALERRTSGRA